MVLPDNAPTPWTFSYTTGRYTRRIHAYEASVWPRATGKRWSASVGTDHRSATGQGFLSQEEAQQWCEQYAASFAASERTLAQPDTTS